MSTEKPQGSASQPLNVLLSEKLEIVCADYSISRDERDSVLMSIRKFLEDLPGEELEVKAISSNSGVGATKTKALMYTMLYTGALVCSPVKEDGIIHFYDRNIYGSPVNR